MVKCPRCGKDIDYLCYEQECTAYGTYSNREYEESSCESNNTERFYCPECNNILFEDSSEADSFLEDD